jgi:hypothetical protein
MVNGGATFDLLALRVENMAKMIPWIKKRGADFTYRPFRVRIICKGDLLGPIPIPKIYPNGS